MTKRNPTALSVVIDFTGINQALVKLGESVNKALESVNETLKSHSIEELRKRLEEEERWRTDPLQIKKSLEEAYGIELAFRPPNVSVASRLRATADLLHDIADRIDP